MTLKDDITRHVDAVFLNADHFAETVTYTPVGGAASSISVVFAPDMMSLLEIPDGNVQATRGTVHLSVADIATPARGDSITRTTQAGGSETWKVDGWHESYGMWALECTLYTEREIVGQGARERRS